MDDKEYRLEDAVTSIQAAIQDLDRRLLRITLKGGVGNDTRRQMLAHLDTIRSNIAKIPEIV